VSPTLAVSLPIRIAGSPSLFGELDVEALSVKPWIAKLSFRRIEKPHLPVRARSRGGEAD
jgi:hypothetical protein